MQKVTKRYTQTNRKNPDTHLDVTVLMEEGKIDSIVSLQAIDEKGTVIDVTHIMMEHFNADTYLRDEDFREILHSARFF